MHCSKCQHENRDGAKFCEECGTPFKRQCASCGAGLRSTAKFCDECGAPTLAAGSRQPRAAEVAGVRKVVTVVFADLAGSTALQERVDAESARVLMEQYYETLRGVVEEHGGTVVKLLGDGVMAAFGVPQVAEDDAIRAVRSGVAMQAAFRGLVSDQAAVLADVGLRVAVNTGEVVVSDGNDDVVGDPVNVAARLQEEASDGDVVIGEATGRLVASLVTLEQLGSFALKGRSEAVTAHRVVSLERPAGASTMPFVGRIAELARLTAVYDAAAAAPAAKLAVLLGGPGLGKSRLIAELGSRLDGGASVIDAHCESTGGATFAPLADALREFLGIDDGAGMDGLRAAIESTLPPDELERTRIASGVASLIAGSPAPPEETFFVVRRLLASLAARQSIVLVVDDLQWAEPLLLDLVEHLVQWGGDVPLFVLVGARPELRDVRSSLVTPGGLVADVVTLDGLDASAAMQLAAHVIGASDVPAAVAAKVLATSEGNPLFVGELVRMLVHEGVLTREGERWVVGEGLAAFETPPTIHALLAARIERLNAEDRAVLERAAVIGRQFSRSAVAELLPGGSGDLDARLEALRRSELIEGDAGWFLGEPALRFHHVLIRDAAYRRLLKGTRTELHARFADWVEARVGDSVEHDETIGWHLEQAHQLLGELGPIDESGRAVGERAAGRLASAGRRALASDDVSLAANLLGRALDRLDATDPARADLALDGCEALLAAGDVGPAARVIAELGELASGSDRLRAWHTCFVGQLTALTAPEELNATAAAVASAAEQLATLDDAAGEAKAHFVHAETLARLGKVGAAEAALDRALAAARSADDRRRANAVLAGAPLAALWGPSPVTRASGRCLDVVRVLRITQGAPAVESVALSCQGVLEALRGRTDAARRMIASSRKMVEELGISHRLFETDVFAARIDLLEGKAASAERGLRGAFEGLRDLGLGIDAARAAALLARALLVQDRAAEAEELSHDSETLAGDDLQAAIAWRGVRAEALARRGETEAAIDLARAAVEIAAGTDALLDHADARLALAAALRGAGRRGEADAEEGRALELWESKGASLLAERARRDGAGPVAEPDAAAAGIVDPSTVRSARRRVRPNAASALVAGVEAALRARDLDAVDALLGQRMETVEHTTGATYGRGGQLESTRRMMRVRDLDVRIEALATLGDSLCLARRVVGGSVPSGGNFDGAAYEMEQLILSELDTAGQLGRSEVFAPDHLGDAVVRLYELYAAQCPDGAERDRAAMTARSVDAFNGSLDGRRRFAPVFAPDLEFVDHRLLGTWNASGAESMLEQFRSLNEVAEDTVMRWDELLGLVPEAILIRAIHYGTELSGGGAYEREYLLVLAAGSDGRLRHGELFDVGEEAAALARFDELTVDDASSVVSQFANTVTRGIAEYERCWEARDWEGVAGAFSPDIRFDDRRRLFRVEFGGDEFVESHRLLFDQPESRMPFSVRATRGDRLALALVSYRAAVEAGGPLEFPEAVILCETGVDDRVIAVALFDLEDEDAAYAELDRRYYAGDAAEHDTHEDIIRTFVEAVASHDWSRVVARCAPSFVEYDRRRLAVLGTTRGAEEWVQNFRALAQLAPDTVVRVNHMRPCARGVLFQVTWCGTREGGAYEVPLLSVLESDDERRYVRADFYDLDQGDDAQARFGELADESTHARRARVHPNAATRNRDRARAAFVARDVDALMATVSERIAVIDHPTGTQYGAPEVLASFRWLFSERRTTHEQAALASLGESLALVRASTWSDGLADDEAGPSEMDTVTVYEVDEHELVRRGDIFAVDHLGKAIVCLYERYAASLPDGSQRDRAAMTARAIEVLRGRVDVERLAPALAPDVEVVDNRVIGTWNASGAADMLQQFRSLGEVAQDVILRDEEVLALRPEALLVRQTHSGTEIVGGGGYLREYLLLSVFGHDGRLGHNELFEVASVSAALARMDELVGGGEAGSSLRACASPFENAASHAWRASIASWVRREARGFWGAHARSLRYRDHRRQFRLDLDREQFVEFTRPLLPLATGASVEVLATRGERLVLSRFNVTLAEEPVGDSEIDSLIVVETDEAGKIVAYDRYDPDDLDAAYAQLDARWEAGEAREHPRESGWCAEFRRAFAGRDWDAMATMDASDQVAHNHRLVGWGTLRGGGAWIPTLKELVALAPDVQQRVDHVRVCDGGLLMQYVWYGTRDGGAFETPVAMTAEINSDGKQQRFDVWDADRSEAALARFAEIHVGATSSASCVPRFENAAVQTVERGLAAVAARDWERFSGMFATEFRGIDRRALLRLERVDREQWLDSHRQIIEMTSSRPGQRVIATRGDRLVLTRVLWRGEEGDVGPSEIDWLLIVEADERGDHLTVVAFDPDDLDAAYTDLDERYSSGEGAAHDLVPAASAALSDAMNRRDWDAVAAICHPTYRVNDHRLLGWGTTLEDAATLIRSQEALVELSSDARYCTDHLRTTDSASLGWVTRTGTREGGEFANSFINVVGWNREGKALSMDVYDCEQLDEAYARFDGLRSGAIARYDEAPVEPNAACVAMDGWHAAFNAGVDTGDWDFMRRACAPAMVFEDRRRMVLLSGDCELMIASASERVATGARPEIRLLGTAGDRVAVWRMLWTGGPVDGRFEIEYISVTEVDESGLITSILLLDNDDPRAAQREAWARWAAVDPVAAQWVDVISTVADSYNDHDTTALRAIYAEDIVVDDRRRTGFGRIAGPDAYVEAVVALWDLAPDTRVELGWYWPACGQHAAIATLRRSGTIVDGGPFEIDDLILITMSGGMITRIELFEIDALDTALARFEELRPDPLRIPPSAATRACERWCDAVNSGDRAAAAALHHPSQVVDDRRRLIRTITDREAQIRNLEFLIDGGWSMTTTLLATVGDRLAFHKWLVTTGEAGARSEIEALAIDEVDEEGRFVLSINFDPGDRAAASQELWDRGFGVMPGGATSVAATYTRAWSAHDVAQLRGLLRSDYYHHDHRRTGTGRIESADAYLESLSALYGLSPDVRLEPIYQVAAAEHGFLMLNRWIGTNTEGGEFETVFVALFLERDGLTVGVELFEVDDLDVATARFEELRTETKG